MADDSRYSDLRVRLIDTAVQLLAQQGPSALQVRAVAKAAQVSTMAVYSTFGGMPDLLRAVDEHGYRALVAAFEASPKTDDPTADVFRLALVYREVAHRNPHLYDLMFGLSTRGAYRAVEHKPLTNPDTQTAAYRLAYDYLVKAAQRLVAANRVRKEDPAVIAAQLWSFVHGFIGLELAGHFVQFEDCVQKVLVPLGLNMAVALGDERGRAEQSIAAAVRPLKTPARRKSSARKASTVSTRSGKPRGNAARLRAVLQSSDEPSPGSGSGLHPVSGPRIDRGLIYVFRRADVTDAIRR